MGDFYSTMVDPASADDALLLEGKSVGASEAATLSPEEKLARVMYPDRTPTVRALVPSNIAALRQADQARSFYSGPMVNKGPIADYFEPDRAAHGDAKVDATIREAAEIAADIELNDREVERLFSLARQLRTEPVTPEDEAKWKANTVNALERKYGHAATARLQLATRMVVRDPRLKDLLERTRLGNHPEIVSILVEKAGSLQAKGRL